jgi:nicotinamidase-related amidase
MKFYDLLIIDPQNDFMDIAGAALPVPGAAADMERLARWLGTSGERVKSVTVTLDSHASVGIERTTFWVDAQGTAVAPFTTITAADLRCGKYRARHAQRQAQAMAYVDALEGTGHFQLTAWPVHCVTATWGHGIYAPLAQSIAQWEMETGGTCLKVLKGMNPLTEQYSAFRAEVPRSDDASTQLNQGLLHRLAKGIGPLLVAGEAQSHCVAASVQDMMAHLPTPRLSQIILLSDCMSPVSGFESDASRWMEQARSAGLQVLRLTELSGVSP